MKDSSEKKPLIVRKYGGMTLATPQMVSDVAKSVAKLRSQGHPVIVVVSAMGKTTNTLQALAHQITDHPDRREFDMLLSTGERVSAALLSIALNDLGCPSISFTGSQAGIFTDASHSDAKITDVKPIRIEAELAKNKVIVIAGFQGVCPETKEITTLGRGGSDITAIALANHFQALRCEVLKDVDGVYSADPKLVDQPRHHARLTHRQLCQMTLGGAKFLHHRASELARELGTEILIDSAHGPNRGTMVSSTATEDTNLPSDFLGLTRKSLKAGTEISLIFSGPPQKAQLEVIDKEIQSSGISPVKTFMNEECWTAVFDKEDLQGLPQKLHDALIG